MTMPSDVMYGLHHDIVYRRLEHALFPLQLKTELLSILISSTFLRFRTWFVIIKLRLGNVIYL